MKKRGYILLISALVLGIILGIISYIYERNIENGLKAHYFEEYKFELSYPDAYVDISVSGEDESQLLSNLTIKESGESISEYMQKLTFVETVGNYKNELNGIRLIIEAINIEKTNLSLEEICKRYVIMFKIYNENSVVMETDNEIIKLNETDVGKVTIKVEGEKENSIVRAYLISLEDREITVTFIAPESTFDRFEKEIESIINSIRF